jgi:hypothetical protein
VSLSDIIQFVGTGSVPVVVAGSVLGVFELGEKLASQRAKDALSKWLLTFDVQKAGALPDGTQELFERIFGERHFSLRCFVRSVAFSVGAMGFIAVLLFLISPSWIGEIFQSLSERGTFLWLALWLPWSILVDYVSLLKTRFILGFLTQMRRRDAITAVAIVGIDYIAYRLLFIFGLLVVLSVLSNFNPGDIWMSPSFDLTNILTFMTSAWQNLPFIPRDITLTSIAYWSGFAPSIWMWLYVLASFVTRALLRSERIVNWLRWFLDVDKNPFRSIGAVAATLAFIATVAIILVSAEVSRITEAA